MRHRSTAPMKRLSIANPRQKSSPNALRKSLPPLLRRDKAGARSAPFFSGAHGHVAASTKDSWKRWHGALCVRSAAASGAKSFAASSDHSLADDGAEPPQHAAELRF